MRVIESLIAAKTGRIADCEDGIYVGGHLIALLDGATSKSGELVNGVSSGRFAMQKSIEVLPAVDYEDDAYNTLRRLSRQLKEAAAQSGYKETPAASILYYNDVKKEIVSYGDCTASVNGKKHTTRKLLDAKLSGVRARILRAALRKGASVESLQQNDVGRAAILDRLKSSVQCANTPGIYGYPALNGGEVLKKFCRIIRVHTPSEIIFASDGYPSVLETLSDSENALRRALASDPLCIGAYKSTKGLCVGAESYDDRSYIRFSV